MTKKNNDKPIALPIMQKWVYHGTRQMTRNINKGSEESTLQLGDKEDQNDKRSLIKPSKILWWRAIWNVITGKKLNILLVVLPLAGMADSLAWGSVYTFILGFLALIPLVGILSDFTEELAMNTNTRIAGIIHAIFGNAVEIMMGIEMLRLNEISLLQSTLMGLILSNTLFLVGACFFFCGINTRIQKFNFTIVTANLSVLLLATFLVILPTTLGGYEGMDNEKVLLISRIGSIFMLFVYIFFVYFQLFTHNSLLKIEEPQQTPEMGRLISTLGVICSFLLVLIYSAFFVSSIDGFSNKMNISKTFIGMILLPIFGNGAEHITAVTLASKRRMDLALGIGIGSAIQVALFVTPLVTLIGWMMGTGMTLFYPNNQITFFIFSIFVVVLCIINGRCNWLGGLLLLSSYFLISITFSLT